MREVYKINDMDTFLSSHPVFRLEELRDYRSASRASSDRSVESLLQYYQRTGRIESIRQGVYAVVPKGSASSQGVADPFLVAGRCVPDAVIVNHSALEFHGLAYSQFRTYTFQTHFTARRFDYQGSSFVPVSPAGALKRTGNEVMETTTGERYGLTVTVSSIERSLVDVINAPRWSGSWEEIWRSLGSIDYVDPGRIVTYLRVLSNATTAARVGWFLDSHREQFMLDQEHLQEIHEMQPSKPVYLDRAHSGPTRFVREWNLVVPVYIAEESWEELT
jgi:predicted transcriptional regulator of viral defense system